MMRRTALLILILGSGCGLGAQAEGPRPEADLGPRPDGAEMLTLSAGNLYPRVGEQVRLSAQVTGQAVLGFGWTVKDPLEQQADPVRAPDDDGRARSVILTVKLPGTYRVRCTALLAAGGQLQEEVSLDVSDPTVPSRQYRLRVTPPPKYPELSAKEVAITMAGADRRGQLVTLEELPRRDVQVSWGGKQVDTQLRIYSPGGDPAPRDEFLPGGKAELRLPGSFRALFIPGQPIASSLVMRIDAVAGLPAPWKVDVEVGAPVSGTVRSGSAPLPGASVSLAVPAENLLSPSTVGFTDAGGGFSLLARGGEAAVFAIAPPAQSGLPVAVATVDVPPAGGVGWTFTYDKVEKSTVTATLSRFEGGPPAAGALVVLSREDATPVGTLELGGKGSAVAIGRYRYLLTSGTAGELREVATGAATLALPAGTYLAEVWPARAETRDQGYRRSTVVLPAGTASLALALGRRVQLSGSVSGPLGKALPSGARVQVTAAAGEERTFTGTVDEQGRFKLDVDDKSAYTITARILGPGGRRLGTLTLASGLLVEGGGTLPEQKLPPAVLYSGTLRAPGGFVVPGALIRLWCDDPGCPTSGELVDETQSSADGSFELRIPTR